MHLFVRNGGSAYISGRIYYFKIYEGNILKRDYIPVLDKDGHPCLFDKAEKKYYYNESQTEFNYEVAKTTYKDNTGKKYHEISYLESTGTQYIDTGVIGKSGLELDTTILFPIVNGNSSIVSSRNQNNRIYLLHSYPGRFTLGYGNYYSSDVNIVTNKKYSIYSKLYSGQQIMKVDDEIILSKEIQNEINTNLNLYLFGNNMDGSFSDKAGVRIYDLKLIYNNQLVRDYIPVLDANDRPCLFDKVSKTCFYNQGTGEFLYG